MQAFLEFVGKWIDLIVSFFKDYPLAAALVTIVAAILYVGVWKHWFSFAKRWTVNTWPKHMLLFFVVILAWSVAIPIVGAVLKALGFVFGGTAWLYKKYESHPIYCLSETVAIAILGCIWFFLPSKWRPKRWKRVVIAVLIWFLLLVLVVPLLDAISNQDEKRPDANKSEQLSICRPIDDGLPVDDSSIQGIRLS